MSMENLKKFMQRVEKDANVAKKAAEIGDGNLAGLIAYGKELKLDFDENDWETFHKEAGGGCQELDDTDLGDVSGGKMPTHWA